MLDVVCVADLGTWFPQKIYHGWRDSGAEWAAAVGLPEDGRCDTAYMAPVADPTRPEPKPVGVMFSALLKGLAWGDEQLRSLSEYLRFAGLRSGGSGTGRTYQTSETYSPLVAARLKAG
jgi:hypothetical protein